MKSYLLALAFSLPFAGQKLSAQKQEINQLLDAYYGIKNALVQEDGTTAQNQAAEFLKLLAAVEVEKLSALQQKAWKDNAGKIKADATQVSQYSDANQQREVLNGLSNDFFALLKVLKLNDQAVYQQYCPMKKAYWLSAEKEIRNPYYGKKMLTCGSVKETLQ